MGKVIVPPAEECRSMPTIHCPHCKKAMFVDRAVGPISCSSCGRIFEIPGMPADPAICAILTSAATDSDRAPIAHPVGLSPIITPKSRVGLLIGAVAVLSMSGGCLVGGICGLLVGRHLAVSPKNGGDQAKGGTGGQPNRELNGAKPGLPRKNPMTLRVFTATSPREALVFTVNCRLSSYYNYEYYNERETHYSVQMTDEHGGTSVHGFIPKQTDTGKKVLELLKDGNGHVLTLEIEHTGRNPSCVTINRLVE